ncbi:DUF6206 family protein [Candidatus Binatia bacterium]|nr:DUF6206 family protein [Candidatus Binatia bacterium]
MSTLATSPAPSRVVDLLQEFEARLDPARPTVGGARIVGYGEVSTVFAVPNLEGMVCKRMAGFRDDGRAAAYVDVVARYIGELGGLGLAIVETTAVPVHTPAGGPVVYLVQPCVPAAELGHGVLRDASEATLLACVDRLLPWFRRILLANRARTDGYTVAVDGQISNWQFPLAGGIPGEPVLLDVGTPYLRRDGIDEIDIELFLAPAPAPIRPFYRRSRAVQAYIDDYFRPHTLLLDLLGNFHKEGRPDRIPLVLERVNAWLGSEGADLGARPLERGEVDRYYEKDAKLLELYLKLRRLDRFVRTRLLRQRYNFILPGPVRR